MIKDKGSKHPKYTRSWKKFVKHFTHRKNRQATKQILHHEEYDKIPEGHLIKEEDPWGWD